MQMREDWDEIEALGGEEEEFPPPPGPEPASLSTVPLLQALLCVLLLAGLLYLRQTGHPAYGEIQERYRQEAAQAWELPKLSPSPSASPSPSPVPSPAPVAGLPL